MTDKNKTSIIGIGYVLPFILITSLFFLWGIANDMTNPMVSAFKKVMPELSNAQAALVQMAFYGGYATMAIPAALFIRKYSYKTGIIIGLTLYAIGAMLFYPAARYEEYSFFLASLYILTFGLAFLETTSNPFILSMGDESTATQRLNLAQTFNPMGSLTGMLIAQLFIIGSLKSSTYSSEEYDALSVVEQAGIRTHDLSLISTPYIVLGLFVLFMLALIVLVKLPNNKSVEQVSVKLSVKKLTNNKAYYEGVITQVFYVAAQIMIWTFIYQYVDNLNATRPEDNQLVATWFNMAAMIIFLLGRAISTAVMKYIEPAKLMMYFAIGAIIFTMGAIFIVGELGLYSLVAISFTMSLMFPTIYGIALKKMGDEAKLGSAGLVMAIVGGALMPPLQGMILDIGGPGFADKLFFGYVPEVNLSFVLPLVSFVVVFGYSFRSLRRGISNTNYMMK
jgi:FHS family L-fucose permease-like MFS transporter